MFITPVLDGCNSSDFEHDITVLVWFWSAQCCVGKRRRHFGLSWKLSPHVNQPTNRL